MSGQRFSGHDPARGSDTGGVPWQGRTLTPTGFEGDTGEADRALTEALARIAATEHPDGHGGGQSDGSTDEESLMAAVAGARLIVPVVAVASELAEQDGHTVDAASDMAAVTLTAPDGTRALPAFTSTGALAAWDSSARPVPVSAARAAQAAVQEGCQVIVIDPPAPGTRSSGRATVALRPSMVWALAMQQRWLPSHRDPAVLAAVATAVATEPRITGHVCGPGADGALQIVLELPPGESAQTVQELITGVAQRLATDGEVRARIDALNFAVRAAGTEPNGP